MVDGSRPVGGGSPKPMQNSGAEGTGNSPNQPGKAAENQSGQPNQISVKVQTAKLSLPWQSLFSGQKKTPAKSEAQMEKAQTLLKGTDASKSMQQGPLESKIAARGNAELFSTPRQESANLNENRPNLIREQFFFGGAIAGFFQTFVEEMDLQAIRRSLHERGMLGFFKLAWYDSKKKRPASLPFSFAVNGILFAILLWFMIQTFA